MILCDFQQVTSTFGDPVFFVCKMGVMIVPIWLINSIKYLFPSRFYIRYWISIISKKKKKRANKE